MRYYRFNFWRSVVTTVVGCVALAVIVTALSWSMILAEIIVKVIRGH